MSDDIHMELHSDLASAQLYQELTDDAASAQLHRELTDDAASAQLHREPTDDAASAQQYREPTDDSASAQLYREPLDNSAAVQLYRESPDGILTEQSRREPSCGSANEEYRRLLRSRHRIVVKIGSSSLLHTETGRLDYHRIDRLARELSDLKNRGKDVILVSSGATAVGREAMGAAAGRVISGVHAEFPSAGDASMSRKQAFASIGQARLIMIYQKFFEDYNQVTGQILMTKTTVVNPSSRENLYNTLSELLALGVIPIVNENDSVATLEYSLGDNDSLSAMVAGIIHADLLILLSDVDGLYTDDPRSNLDAKFIDYVPHLTDEIMRMGKETTGSGVGTGGMNTKLHAAKMATASGCDMVIVNTRHGMGVIREIMNGRSIGTLFRAEQDPEFDLIEYVEETY